MHQRHYHLLNAGSQIQQDALAVISFTPDVPPLSVWMKVHLGNGPQTTGSLCSTQPREAANRLAEWTLTLSQYECTIEHHSTKVYGNAYALSRSPIGSDDNFNREEEPANVNTVCNVKEFSHQLNPVKPKLNAQHNAQQRSTSSLKCNAALKMDSQVGSKMRWNNPRS